MDHQLKCKNCGKTYLLPENSYMKLQLKVLWTGKMQGLGNIEVFQFMNVSAGCCRKPDYKDTLV